MQRIKIKTKLTKNQWMIYGIFKENPYVLFSVKDIITKINEKKEKVSERTIYRTIKSLMKKGKIHCSDICRGTRSYGLVKSNKITIVCKKCDFVKMVKIENKYKIKDKMKVQGQDFTMLGRYIRVEGICRNCKCNA